MKSWQEYTEERNVRIFRIFYFTTREFPLPGASETLLRSEERDKERGCFFIIVYCEDDSSFIVKKQTNNVYGKCDN